MAETTPAAAPRRARDLGELREKMGRLVTRASLEAGRAFVPRPTDVIISPFAKCGTTWLQQIVHTLRTGGDLDFDDISRVVPWIETALDLGIDLDAEQRGEPRAFKSHMAGDVVPAGARCIVASRDPRDAMVSAHKFFEGWFFEPGAIDVETLARAHFLATRDYYTHLASWWRRRDEPDVLFLAYEHMLREPRAAVARIASFIGIDADDALLDVALEQSSITSMKVHAAKYDDLMMRTRSETACDLPPGSDSSKVRSGGSGSHRSEMSPALLAEFDAAWRETMGAEFGLASYAALLDALAARP